MTQSPGPALCIVYFSGQGHTRRLAKAIAEGAGGARLVDIEDRSAEDIAALADAALIAFGAPTYMGSTAAAFDTFLEEVAADWPDHPWSGKMAAGFTVASHPSGDKWAALTRIWVYAMQLGMLWVGANETGAPVRPSEQGINRDGAWIGLMATSDRDKARLIGDGDLETARRFGARLAWAARSWQPDQGARMRE